MQYDTFLIIITAKQTLVPLLCWYVEIVSLNLYSRGNVKYPHVSIN